ncbi:CTP synthase [Bienertia sinuspersici]
MSHPYLNTDAGTMSPFEHGEVFVLDDGGESVLERERKGDYLGKTVQVVVPNISVDGKDEAADETSSQCHLSRHSGYYLLQLKKRPTQHSVRELRALGLTPHPLAC